MTPERFARVKAIFVEAMDRAPEDRARVVEASSEGDAELASQVLELLANHTRDDEFLRPTSRGESSMLVGRRVGAFTIVRTIASGGMGTVFEATQHHPQRSVALKVLRTALASRASVRRFEEESAILARLRHPCIAQVYEAGVHQEGGVKIPYFAMELIEHAETITSYADRQRLGIRERVELFVRVCDAVHHGHQNAVIHRDLKPANILVGRDGMPRVIDFGVARVTNADPPSNTQRTDAGQLVGTLSYMSPEQAMSSRGADVDTRSDVYTLGLVLYEMLCGQKAYEIAELPLAEATSVIRERVPVRPGTIHADLRGDLETIALKALEKDRDRRYQSAAELAEDLRRCLRQEPIMARPSTVAYQVRLFARRHRPLVAAAGVVALALVAGTGVSVWFAMKEREQSIRANLATLEATREAERARRIREFLQGALGSANPFLPIAVAPGLLASDFDPWGDYRRSSWGYSGRIGEAATVRDLLVAAATRVPADFRHDPIGEAEVSDVLGWTLHVLGDGEHSTRLLERAYTLRKASRDSSAEDVVRTNLHLAEHHHRAWRGAEAEALYREALDASYRAFGAFDPRTLSIERMRAETVAVALGRPRDAATKLANVIDNAREAAREHDPAVLETRAYLARLLAIVGDRESAEKMIEATEDALRTKVGEDDPRWGEVFESMTTIYTLDPDRVDEALAAAQRALRSREHWFGTRSLKAAFARKLLARVHRARNDLRSALDAELAAEEVFRNLAGPEQWEAMRTRASCGELMVRLGERLDEAERMLREAAVGMDKFYGKSSGYGAEYTAWAARARGAKGKPEGAIELMKPAIEAMREFAATGVMAKQVLAAALEDLANWHEAVGARESARVAVLEAMELVGVESEMRARMRAKYLSLSDVAGGAGEHPSERK